MAPAPTESSKGGVAAGTVTADPSITAEALSAAAKKA